MTTMIDQAFLSIGELVERLDGGELSSREATEAQLARIAAIDGSLNAYITVMAEQALAAADRADAQRQNGERGPLLGVPLAVKDLFATAGVRTTAGSRVLAGSIPETTATAVQRLEEAGAVILGKTNMMEFAYGYPHPDYGETRNPWDTTRTAGGSSGGSAAAVTAGLAYGALGSDTGGSIRSPAAYCGIVGLKPTYGRVSRHDVVPLAWSLDHCGPLTRTARDCAIIFDAIAGYDPRDPASAQQPFTPTLPEATGDVRSLRVGIVEQFFERHVEPEIGELARQAVQALEGLGVALEPVTFSFVPLIGPAIMPIIQAEATSYHWKTLLERPEDFGPDIRENLRLGALVLAKDYLDAQRVRRLITEEVTAALTRFDALVFPTQPIVAPPLDAYQVAGAADADVLDVEIGHTGLANLTGHPAISVPCGKTSAGLPVGIQFTGRPFDEATILRLAHGWEQLSGLGQQHPSLEG
jgi:aspartyl-tRNA(Asn)/glutamyl-tRNA(Gln) amidotransferase subunit A